MTQRCLASFARDFREVVTGKLDSQYLVGSDASLGYSIKSHSSGEVRCVFHRDEQDAHAQRQNGIAGFPDYPAANRCSSKPTTADPEPTASPKSADDRG